MFYLIKQVPYARDMTTLLNRSTFLNRTPSQNVKKTPSVVQFMLFLDELAEEKDTEEVSL